MIGIQGCLRASLPAHRSEVASVLILISTQISGFLFYWQNFDLKNIISTYRKDFA